MLIYPVFIPFQGCPFRCIYCQQETITHTSKESEVLALDKIQQFIRIHKDIDKEIAFFGGTFTALDQDIQTDYFNQIKPYIDEKTSFRISTRPDFINEEILEFLAKNKVKTIELGIQSFDDNVLEKSKRGYTASQAEDACNLVKSKGFALCIQLMPGLPDDTNESFEKTMIKTVELKPDYVRIYPTIVIKNTHLETLFLKGEYKPWNLNKTLFAVKNAQQLIKKNKIKLIKIGLHSDLNVQKDEIVAGPWQPNIGEIINGICFMERNCKVDKTIQELTISRYEASMLLGNKRIVLDFCEKVLKIAKPEKIIVDKDFQKGYFNIMY
ncbi:MAG TPA: radical SAM protein [Candidatus Cloacimonadota bacterium]|nr:radical SAM protein [Candidatus Cloacimonadota bacterium]HOQ79990.1 radical SAM protein [Candidatus Cloacimonadota bacterium]